MKVLIINTTKNDSGSNTLGGVDTAITMEMYKLYCNNKLNTKVCANSMFSKYTLLDEKFGTVETYNTMDKLLSSVKWLGNCIIVTHEQWLDKICPNWREEPRYKYW